jgi:hypothetical protein
MDKNSTPFLFSSFGMATFYSFISATVAGLSMNIFVSVCLDSNLDQSNRYLLYTSSVAFIFAALGFFSIASNLEDARRQWTEEGAVNSNVAVVRVIEARLRKLYVSLAIAIGGVVLGFILLYGIDRY